MITRLGFALVGAVLLEAGCGKAVPVAQPVSVTEWRVLRDIEYLASTALGGRQPGQPGADSAAVFIGRRFIELRLRPAFTSCDSTGECATKLYQRFQLPAPYPWNGIVAVNVAALLPGSDPDVRHEVLVVGAHYDHLGRSTDFARDPRRMGIRPGADDNASGTAAMLELARRLAHRPPRRSVLFVAFGAEELGLFGSSVFVDNPPVPLDSLSAMLNLDMVGRLRSRGLIVHGLDTSPMLSAFLDSANATIGLTLRKQRDVGRSDQVSFSEKGVPVLHFFTGEHPDYHTVRDRPDRINTSGLVSIVDLAEAIARAIGDHSDLLLRRN